MPEDQVAKRGTTVQLECRVKHDPSLKLTVSWLKDDEPLYIGNRFLLLLCLLLVCGHALSLALGDTLKKPGTENLCMCVTEELLNRASQPLCLPHPGFLPLSRRLSASLSSLSHSFLSPLLSCSPLPPPLFLLPFF